MYKKQIMIHTVGGYPDLNSFREFIICMNTLGIDYIEVQLPFSDPLCDGTAITEANQHVIRNNIKTHEILSLLGEMKSKIKSKIIIMTYANIPFSMGAKNFISKIGEAGVKGLIIPDLPFDEKFSIPVQTLKEQNIRNIPVVSPGSDLTRVKAISERADGFIYSTLKRGVTGNRTTTVNTFAPFMQELRKISVLPVAGGFGIKNSEDLKEVYNYADIGIIGSAFITLMKNRKYKKVKALAQSLVSEKNKW